MGFNMEWMNLIFDGWSSHHATLHRRWLTERRWTSRVQYGICSPLGPGFLPRNFNLSMFFWFLFCFVFFFFFFFFWKLFWKLECKEVSWKWFFEMRNRWLYPSFGIQWKTKKWSPYFSFPFFPLFFYSLFLLISSPPSIFKILKSTHLLSIFCLHTPLPR